MEQTELETSLPPPKRDCEHGPSIQEGKALPLGSESYHVIRNTGVTFCHAYTVGANKKFTLRFHSMVRTVPFRFCVSTIADSTIIGFHTQRVILLAACSTAIDPSLHHLELHVCVASRAQLDDSSQQGFVQDFFLGGM